MGEKAFTAVGFSLRRRLIVLSAPPVAITPQEKMGLVSFYFSLSLRGSYFPSAGQSNAPFGGKARCFFTGNFLVFLSAVFLNVSGVFCSSAALPLAGPGLQVLKQVPGKRVSH